jgi:glycosyltransferase involved in cell wall biosynthesis
VAAVRDVLKEGNDVHFTFAGEGPDEEWMRDQFGNESRVTFTRFLSQERMAIHRAHEIAVVPSLGSEGTSLSVAEGMAAGCAVLATAVGGITNMILSEYNGILVLPEKDQLIAGLRRLIRDADLRTNLGARAQETARHAFSLDRWRAQWREVLRTIRQSAARR